MASKHKCLALPTYISFLTQWHNYLLYIVEVIDDFFMNLVFTKLKLRLTWKLSCQLGSFLRVSWIQNCILIFVSIDYFSAKLFIYMCVLLLLFINDRVLCLHKIGHIDVKCGKISLHLKLTLNGLVYVTFNVSLIKFISLK